MPKTSLLARCLILPLLLLAIFNFNLATASAQRTIIIQSTSSFEDSGLLDYLAKKFKKDKNIHIRTVALGSGLALAAAERGEADVIITHSPDLEKQYEAKGIFLVRSPLFYNDFVLVGNDKQLSAFQPLPNVLSAFRYIEKNQLLFLSRGDKSGTHSKELMIWQKSGFNPKQFSHQWYKELGQPMGKTLQSAIAWDGITLADRATYLKSKTRHFVILFQGDSLLCNDYSIMLMQPKKYPNLNHKDATIFFDWILSDEIQQYISKYKVRGEQVFFQYPKLNQ